VVFDLLDSSRGESRSSPNRSQETASHALLGEDSQGFKAGRMTQKCCNGIQFDGKSPTRGQRAGDQSLRNICPFPLNLLQRFEPELSGRSFDNGAAIMEPAKNRRLHSPRKFLEAENSKISERTHRGIKAIAFSDIYEANLRSRWENTTVPNEPNGALTAAKSMASRRFRNSACPETFVSFTPILGRTAQRLVARRESNHPPSRLMNSVGGN
jgi:hypothetical protein